MCFVKIKATSEADILIKNFSQNGYGLKHMCTIMTFRQGNGAGNQRIALKMPRWVRKTRRRSPKWNRKQTHRAAWPQIAPPKTHDCGHWLVCSYVGLRGAMFSMEHTSKLQPKKTPKFWMNLDLDENSSKSVLHRELVKFILCFSCTENR